MMKVTAITVATALALAAPAVGRTVNADAVVQQAATVLGADPAKAVALVEPVIAESSAMTPKPNTNYFCADAQTNTIGELFGSTLEGRNGVELPNSTCAALFMKGFALIDLGRRAEAEPFLRRATELAPGDAHYLNEYAEWWKGERQWQRSYDLFAAAVALAPKQPADGRDKILARSLRGMGFNLIELGRLDDAERKFNDSLKLDPDSPAATNELKYIAEQRTKMGKRPAS